MLQLCLSTEVTFTCSEHACSFQEEKEIVAMMDLRMAYEGNDLAKFERTLHDKRNRITEDPFVMTYLDPLRRRIRESVLLHLCRPYKKITMTFMAGVSMTSKPLHPTPSHLTG